MNPIEGTTASSQTKSEDSSDSPKPHKPTTQPPEKTAEVEEDSSEMQNQMPDEIPDLYCYTPQDSLSEEDSEGLLLGPETDSVEIPQVPSEETSKNPGPINLPLIQTNGPSAIPPHTNHQVVNHQVNHQGSNHLFASSITQYPQAHQNHLHTNHHYSQSNHSQTNQNSFTSGLRKEIRTYPPHNMGNHNLNQHHMYLNTQAPAPNNYHTYNGNHNGSHNGSHNGNHNGSHNANHNGSHNIPNFSMLANAEELGDGYFQDYGNYNGTYEEEYKTQDVLLKQSPKYQLIPKKYQKRIEEFYYVMEEARGSKVLIIIKGHPDPDSIACAFTQHYINDCFDIKTTILYFDEISHPENQALVKGIDIKMSCYSDVEDFDFADFDYLCFVDTPNTDLPVDIENPPPVLSLVDHHKVDHENSAKARFVDIREDYGATSTIYAEYLELLVPFNLNNSRNLDTFVATALTHGIRTDTDHLMLASPMDFYAAGYLKQFLDKDLLRMVSKQSVTAHTMDIIKQGLKNKVIKSTILIAGVGFVRDEDRDGIGQTADFLLRHEGVETAIVFGIVNGDALDGSLRTSSAKIDPDRWIKEVFGQDSTGKHYGGGRRNKGGFRIPLGLLARCTDRKALWKLGEQTILELIHNKIGEKFVAETDEESDD